MPSRPSRLGGLIFPLLGLVGAVCELCCGLRLYRGEPTPAKVRLNPDTQARIKGSKLYRFCLYYPLRAFYGLTWLARNNRAASLGVSAGITVLSLCALIAGIVGWDRIWYPQHTFSFVWFAAFILVPALLLVAATIYLVFVKKKDKASPEKVPNNE